MKVWLYDHDGWVAELDVEKELPRRVDHEDHCYVLVGQGLYRIDLCFDDAEEA